MGVPQAHDLPDRSSWRETTLSQRAAVAARAAAILRERAEEFARSVTSEVGELLDEARREVTLGAEIIEFYARTAAQPMFARGSSAPLLRPARELFLRSTRASLGPESPGRKHRDGQALR